MPDEPTARRWYDNHPDLYATPEYRRVKVIVLSPATLASEVNCDKRGCPGGLRSAQG